MRFRVSDEDLNRETREEHYYLSLGSRQLAQLAGGREIDLNARHRVNYTTCQLRLPGEPPSSTTFKYEDFETCIRVRYGRTVPDYKKLLAREVLAQHMRDVVTVNVRVSENEAWREYARQHNQTAIRYIPFSPEFYRATVRDDVPANVEAFARTNEREVNSQ